MFRLAVGAPWGRRPCLPHPPRSGTRSPARRPCKPCAFQIDRRHHLELQWQRQAEQDALLAGVPAALQSGRVLEVQSLQHLERILEAASGQLVVLTVYSRSCGICKAVLRELEAVCAESRQQRARIVFLRHDLHDAFDWPSDVARMYTIKSAPRFLFFVDGALVRTASIADSRRMAHGSRTEVQRVLELEHRRLRGTLWELLVKNAPSARR
ncbi:hypothetical protein ABPG77_009516 [Micractinium sp. CCAP 211/92]